MFVFSILLASVFQVDLYSAVCFELYSGERERESKGVGKEGGGGGEELQHPCLLVATLSTDLFLHLMKT